MQRERSTTNKMVNTTAPRRCPRAPPIDQNDSLPAPIASKAAAASAAGGAQASVLQERLQFIERVRLGLLERRLV